MTGSIEIAPSWRKRQTRHKRFVHAITLTMADKQGSLHVSLIAIPEAVISTLSGIYDVLNSFEMLAGYDDAIPTTPPFKIEIVGQECGEVELASGLPIHTHRGVDGIVRTDEPVDQISWQVGYEDASYFRRLFKRVTGIPPASYRRKFQVPKYAASTPGGRKS